MAVLQAVKRALSFGEPSASSIVWERERKVLKAITLSILKDQPYNLAGRYSWLTSPYSNCELQIDILFPSITEIAGIKLAKPTCLAIEVQSSLHDGKWNNSKKRFFRTKEEFVRYTANQEWKRLQIQAHNIPFLEIDPSKDDLAQKPLRKMIGSVLGVML